MLRLSSFRHEGEICYFWYFRQFCNKDLEGSSIRKLIDLENKCSKFIPTCCETCSSTKRAHSIFKSVSICFHVERERCFLQVQNWSPKVTIRLFQKIESHEAFKHVMKESKDLNNYNLSTLLGNSRKTYLQTSHLVL